MPCYPSSTRSQHTLSIPSQQPLSRYTLSPQIISPLQWGVDAMLSQLNTLVAGAEHKDKGSDTHKDKGSAAAPLGKGGAYTPPLSTDGSLTSENNKEKDQNAQCLSSLLALMIEVAQDRTYLRILVGKLSMSTLRQLMGCVGARACEPLVTRLMAVPQVMGIHIHSYAIYQYTLPINTHTHTYLHINTHYLSTHNLSSPLAHHHPLFFSHPLSPFVILVIPR